MVVTYEKSRLDNTGDIVFPYVPDQQTYISSSAMVKCRFVNLGLNSRPTFFGCNASNYTSFSRIPSLVIYFPHTGWTAYTNYSTFVLQFNDTQVDQFMQNGAATVVLPSPTFLIKVTRK